MSNQFIGPNKVLGITQEEMTTPLGSEIIKVVYENNPSQLMTRKAFDLLVTEVAPPGGYNYIQEKKFAVLVPMLVDLIMEFDLNYYEIGRLGQTLVDQTFERFHRASHFLWSGTDQGYAPGLDFLNTKTVLDAMKIIESIPKSDGKSEGEQSGVGAATEVEPGVSGEAAS